MRTLSIAIVVALLGFAPAVASAKKHQARQPQKHATQRAKVSKHAKHAAKRVRAQHAHNSGERALMTANRS